MDADQLVTLRGLSRELKISIEWLKAEADAGRVPCLRAGRKRLFNVDAVRQALLRRAAGENAPPVPRDTSGDVAAEPRGEEEPS